MGDPLYTDPDLARFYDLENAAGADFDFCRSLAESDDSVLDMGCGTGALAARLARRCEVVGVDPAGAMLDIARARPGGDGVRWVQADARTVRLEQRFDLVVLTGHAFQVFLTDADRRAVLASIAAHLSPRGRFVFDTRNPAAEAWRGWTPERSRRTPRHPELGPVEVWNDATHEAGVVTYQTHYRLVSTGERRSAETRIGFIDQARLARLLNQAGLAVDTWLGDWIGGALTAASPEIIPLGRRR